jgi:hypothetical protein
VCLPGTLRRRTEPIRQAARGLFRVVRGVHSASIRCKGGPVRCPSLSSSPWALRGQAFLSMAALGGGGPSCPPAVRCLSSSLRERRERFFPCIPYNFDCTTALHCTSTLCSPPPGTRRTSPWGVHVSPGPLLRCERASFSASPAIETAQGPTQIMCQSRSRRRRWRRRSGKCSTIPGELKRWAGTTSRGTCRTRHRAGSLSSPWDILVTHCRR